MNEIIIIDNKRFERVVDKENKIGCRRCCFFNDEGCANPYYLEYTPMYCGNPESYFLDVTKKASKIS